MFEIFSWVFPLCIHKRKMDINENISNQVEAKNMEESFLHFAPSNLSI